MITLKNTHRFLPSAKQHGAWILGKGQTLMEWDGLINEALHEIHNTLATGFFLKNLQL